MKTIEKILKKTIIKSQKKDLLTYYINYTSSNNSKINKVKQISKFLYKTTFKNKFSEKTFVKFPLTISNKSQSQYNLLINNKLRFISPYITRNNNLSFTSNENILMSNMLYITFPSLKICKLIISIKDH